MSSVEQHLESVGNSAMTKDEIYDRLTTLFREFFDNDTLVVSAATTANDIEEWDSFANISLMIAVESRFGIRLTTTEIETFKSVGDLASTIERKAR